MADSERQSLAKETKPIDYGAREGKRGARMDYSLAVSADGNSSSHQSTGISPTIRQQQTANMLQEVGHMEEDDGGISQRQQPRTTSISIRMVEGERGGNASNSTSNINNNNNNINNINGSRSSSVDDGFHCHNREEEDEDRHGSSRSETSKRAKKVLWMSVGVCLFFMICEVIGGIWAQSLAIITDAAHLLTDLASMLISLFSIYLASRPASQRMSFGWYRAEVLGAFVSVIMIWVVTGILVYLAIDRMITAVYDIDATVMSITAGIGVCVNLVMGLLLYFGGHSHSHHGHGHGGHQHVQLQQQTSQRMTMANGGAMVPRYREGEEERELLFAQSTEEMETERARASGNATNINVRAAFIHVIGDLIQSVGVLVASLMILLNPSWGVIDPICTLMFSFIVLSTTLYIIRDALVVLLEGRPSNIDFRVVFVALEAIEGVKKVHDLRIWALTMNRVAISVHLEIDTSADSQHILKSTTRMLRREFKVHESTVQIEGYQPEMENCDQCVIPPK